MNKKAGYAWAFAFLFVMFAFPSKSLAATEAGTVIGNSATAVYYDTDNNIYTTTSNIVQTLVTEICGVDIQPIGGVVSSGSPGQIVYLPYAIQNNGNSVNTYNLEATGGAYSTVIYADANGNGVPDSGEVTVTSATLNINETASFVVAVTVPTIAANGDIDNLTFSATGVTVAGCSASSAGTVNVTTDASITANKSVSSATSAPGDTLTYTVSLKNVGLAKAKAGGTFNVDGLGVDAILVRDAIPSGSTYVASSLSGQPAVNPVGYPVYSADGVNWFTTEAGAGTVNHVGFIMEDGTPGNSILEDVLGIDQQASMTFNVLIDTPFVELDGSVDNFAEVLYSDVAGPITVTTNSTNTDIPSSLSAEISAGGLDGYTWNGSAWVTASVSPTVEEDLAGDYTNDNYVMNAPAGSWVEFRHSAVNISGADDVVNVSALVAETSLPPGSIIEFWNADGSAKLLDTNGDGMVDLGTLAGAGGSRDYTVKVFIPASTGASALDGTVDYFFTVSAQSSNNPLEVDYSRNNIDGIVAGSVDMGSVGTVGDGVNDPADGNNDGTSDSDDAATAVINPAETALYPMEIVNSGSFSDLFNLSFSGTPADTVVSYYSDPNCDGDISDGVEITNTGLIGGTVVRADDLSCTNTTTDVCVYDVSNITAGSNVIVGLDGVKRSVASVSPSTNKITLASPMGAAATAGTTVSEAVCVVMQVQSSSTTPAGSYNIISDVVSPLSGAADSMDAPLTVNQVCSVSVTPDGSGQLPAGGTTAYNHTIANNGNYSVTVDINITGSSALAYVLIADTNLDLTDEIYDPTTGFSVTLAPGASFDFKTDVQAPAGVTTGTVESITINAVADGGTCSAIALDTTTVMEGYLQLIKTRSVASAAPGDTISYTVQYQNIGSKDALNIMLTDNVPNFTTFSPDSYGLGTGLCHDAACDGTCDVMYTNVSGDDVAEYDAVGDLVRFRLGAGATATDGGTVSPGQSGCIMFEVTVD